MTEAVTFPPYSGDDVACPKCGNKGADTTYRAYGRCSHPGDHMVVGWSENERLCRRCLRCDFGWDEATTGQLGEQTGDVDA
jgi:hypothetical protein